MILRARWQGELPQVGHFLMSSTRPRFAYRITAVEVLRALERLPDFTRLKLHVDRVPAADVPDGAIINSWRWDPRKNVGFQGKDAG